MWKSLVLLPFIIFLNTAYALCVVDTITEIKSDLDPYIAEFSEQYDDFQNSEEGKAHQTNVEQEELDAKRERKLSRIYQKPCVYCPSNQYIRNLTREVLVNTEFENTIPIERLIKNAQSLMYYHSNYYSSGKEVNHGREYHHGKVTPLVTGYFLVDPILKDKLIEKLKITYVSYDLIVKLSCDSVIARCTYNLYENHADYVLRMRERLKKSWIEQELVIPTKFDTVQRLSMDEGKVQFVGKGVASTSGYNGQILFDIYKVKGEFLVTGDYEGLHNEYSTGFRLWNDVSLVVKYRIDYYDQYDPSDLEKLDINFANGELGEEVETYFLELQKKF